MLKNLLHGYEAIKSYVLFQRYLRPIYIFRSAIFLIAITDTSSDAESRKEQDGGKHF